MGPVGDSAESAKGSDAYKCYTDYQMDAALAEMGPTGHGDKASPMRGKRGRNVG
jgi:hypothetical protein